MSYPFDLKPPFNDMSEKLVDCFMCSSRGYTRLTTISTLSPSTPHVFVSLRSHNSVHLFCRLNFNAVIKQY